MLRDPLYRILLYIFTVGLGTGATVLAFKMWPCIPVSSDRKIAFALAMVVSLGYLRTIVGLLAGGIIPLTQPTARAFSLIVLSLSTVLVWGALREHG